MKKIALITGWGVGVEPLIPLQHALQKNALQVDLIQIFDAQDPEVFQQHVQLARGYDVIIGWSLGGQLAALLLEAIYQQYGQMKYLMTIASHPCFVSDDAQLHAMPQAQFDGFATSYENNPQSCIKNFLYLITQSANNVLDEAPHKVQNRSQNKAQHKANWLKLQSLVSMQDRALMTRGLNLLNELNIVTILQNYQGPQHHIFARQDAVVNVQVSTLDAYLSANSVSFSLIDGEHACAYFQAEQCAALILNKIYESESRSS